MDQSLGSSIDRPIIGWAKFAPEYEGVIGASKKAPVTKQRSAPNRPLRTPLESWGNGECIVVVAQGQPGESDESITASACAGTPSRRCLALGARYMRSTSTPAFEFVAISGIAPPRIGGIIQCGMG